MDTYSWQSKHDVFICFGGADIRDGFGSHLCEALRKRRIKIFEMDDLEKGADEISSGVLQRIMEAKVSIVVFSENFAFLSRNLDELVKMLECKKVIGQYVLPVFYHIDRSDVRNVTGKFAAAQKWLKQHFERDRVRRWKYALKEATNLAGWTTAEIRSEAALVERIALAVERALRSSKRRINLELALTVINFILELPSAVFDQLSPTHKPLYALLSMIISFASLLLCIIDLIHKSWKQKVCFRWSLPLPWFYHVSPTSRRFGSFSDIIGFVCAVCQVIVTSINYSFIGRQSGSPISLSVWPIVFAFGLVCSKLIEKLR